MLMPMLDSDLIRLDVTPRFLVYKYFSPLSLFFCLVLLIPRLESISVLALFCFTLSFHSFHFLCEILLNMSADFFVYGTSHSFKFFSLLFFFVMVFVLSHFDLICFKVAEDFVSYYQFNFRRVGHWG